MIVTLPAPYAFPVGSHVRVDQYRGEVIELRGPWSVVLLEPSGRRLVTTTTDLELDPDADQAPASKAAPATQSDLLALL